MPADVLCLSHLRWSFVYQRPQHLMTRWGRDRRVFFVEEPHFDAASPRLDVRVEDPRIHVVVPHVPAGSAPEEVDAIQQQFLESLVAQERLTDVIRWFYTPLAMAWAGHVRSLATVYDCMDELSHFHGAHHALRDRERDLFAAADVVFTGGQSLYEAKRTYHPRVHAFPSSVDAAHFAQARRGMADPPDQAAIPHPRVGFFGVVDERMDMDLLHDLAVLRSDLQLVLLGPVVKISPATLPRLPNIHWLGPKSYSELPSYVAGWEVAMMPFARNDATRFISPTKTLEYLAAGRPVVSTSIRDVVRPYGEEGLVRIADSARNFARAIEGALEEPDDAKARDAFLSSTSWDSTFTRMRALVQEAIACRASVHETKESPCMTT